MRTSNNSNSGSKSSNSIEKSQQYFVKSASYLLYGNDNEKITGDYGVNRTYELDYQFDELSDENYWLNVLRNLDSSIESLAGSNNIETDSYQDLLSFLKLQRSNVEFLSQYNDFSNIIDNETLLNLLLANGMSAADAYIDGLYSNLGEKIVQTHATYFENQLKYYHTVVNLYGLYRTNGCIRNNEVVTTCAASIDATKGTTLIDALAETSSAAKLYVQLLVRRTENNCWIINSSFDELIQAQNGGGVDAN